MIYRVLAPSQVITAGRFLVAIKGSELNQPPSKLNRSLNTMAENESFRDLKWRKLPEPYSFSHNHGFVENGCILQGNDPIGGTGPICYFPDFGRKGIFPLFFGGVGKLPEP